MRLIQGIVIVVLRNGGHRQRTERGSTMKVGGAVGKKKTDTTVEPATTCATTGGVSPHCGYKGSGALRA